MSFNSFKYVLICFCFFSFSLQAKPTTPPPSTIHMIIMADTLDESIGEDVQHDVENVMNEAKNISRYTGMKLNTVLIRDQKLNYKEVTRSLGNLKVGKNDAIFFYFSGHGYRTEDKGNNPWPDLNLADGFTGIDFSLIVETLLKKNPRFILAIADSCNSFIDGDYSIHTYRGMKKAPQKNELQIRENYKTLFLTSKGLVIASGSVPGDYGISIEDGGVFTLAFLETFRKEVLGVQVSWEILMQKTQDRTNHYTYNVSYPLSDGTIVNFSEEINQYPQWIYLSDISNVKETLKLIGR